MSKSILKATLRGIRHSLGRFLAILFMVLLGVTFFSGFQAVGPDLSASATRYFAQSGFHNYRLQSNIGFDENDVTAIRALGGVQDAQAFYTLDALQSSGSESNVVHVVSLPETVDKLTVAQGRLPASAGECVVDEQKNGSPPQIGETVTLYSGDGDDLSQKLHVTVFKVVGIVNSPAYLARDRGSSKLGNGKVGGLVFIQSADFSLSAYTEVDVTATRLAGLDVFGGAYSAAASSLGKSLQTLAAQRTAIRHDELVNDANAQLAAQQDDYNTQAAQATQAIANAQAQIDSAQTQIDTAQVQLNAAQKQSDTQMATTQAQLKSASAQLASQTAAYNQSLTEYNRSAADAQTQMEQATQSVDTLTAQIAAAQAQAHTLDTQLKSGQQNGTLSDTQAQAMQAQIEQLQTSIASMTAKQQQAQAGLAAQQQKMTDAQTQLASAKTQLDAAQKQLDTQQAAFSAARAQAQAAFAQKQNQIDSRKTALEQSRATLAAQQADADQKLNDAQQQLNDAKQRISDIATPQWAIQSRDKNAGYTTLKSSLDRNSGLSGLLPTLFFGIAALVCLTTMTRMVEERRTQIGTLKALGYGNGAIAFQFLFYAGAASLAGSLIGIALGFTALPAVLFKAYTSAMTLPVRVIVFQPATAALAAGIALGVILFATAFTCMSELRVVPAALMRPQAPKAGKRILLERVPFLWNHLRFSYKVTARNLFRYKKRFWMTVLGIACCSALMVTGLGMRDSISTQVSEREFGQILKYGMTVQMKNDATAGQAAAVAEMLEQTAGVKSSLLVAQKSVTLKNGSVTKTSNLLVPQQPAALPAYFALRETPARFSKQGKAIKLDDSGVVLTQQLADSLHLKTGDTLTIQDDDTHTHRFRITGVAENYLMNDVFLTPAAYQEAYGSAAEVNQLMVDLNSGADESAVSSHVMKQDGVAAVTLLSDLKKTFSDTVKSLNGVVAVIILAAVLLAVVVLFTLTSINIAERYREIATIKVLGFYDREVSGYVTRESYLLALIGILFGFVGGILLHKYLLNVIAVDNIMFVQSILPASFAVAAALTLALTRLINALFMGALRKIDMVEALKGAE